MANKSTNLITPDQTKTMTFSSAAGGYHADEVDDFLDGLAETVDNLMKRLVEMKGRCTQNEARLQTVTAERDSLRRKVAELEGRQSVNGQLSETQLSEVFVVAKQTADRMIDEARERADGIVADADAKSREMLREALAKKQKELDKAEQARLSRASFCDEYREMLRRHLKDAEDLAVTDEGAEAAAAGGKAAPADDGLVQLADAQGAAE